MLKKLTFSPIVLSGLFVTTLLAGKMPADTYFSVAVSENSHNHYGENLMFLDFQEVPDRSVMRSRIVVSPRVDASAIDLDGKADDWDPTLLTTIRGRVMNNYPLGEHRDAVPGDIRIGSAFDQESIYFLLQFEDMNHDASVNRNRWRFNGKQWEITPHTPAKADAPAASAANLKEELAGKEDEDQIFFMFPILDQQGNFRDGSLGCAGYCHPNLSITGDPERSQIGDGVASMHTAFPEDLADLWHWTATRSRPMNTLKDAYIDYGELSYNGRKTDAGTAPFEENVLQKPFRPRYVHKGDLETGRYSQPGYTTQSLSREDLVIITPDMTFAEGVSLPFYIGVPATGSRADVQTAARFDETDFTWTVEFKRKRVTHDEMDHQFVSGADASPPTNSQVAAGNAERGEELYHAKACAACHGGIGEGVYLNNKWHYPRNQRVSAPVIRKAASISRPERLRALVFELKEHAENPPAALMPFIPLTPQEAEDIAAWLQSYFIPRGE